MAQALVESLGGGRLNVLKLMCQKLKSFSLYPEDFVYIIKLHTIYNLFKCLIIFLRLLDEA